MKPKKETSIQYVLYAVLLVIVLFIAFHLAYCKAYVEVLLSTGTVSPQEELSIIFKTLGQKLKEEPFDFIWTDKYSFNYLLYGFLAWFLTVVAIENSKKNYIHGKEYGTARWGKLSDIKMLFSENIAKKEIRELGQRRNVIQRFFLRKKIVKHWTDEGNRIQKALLKDAEIQEFKLRDDASKGVDISNYPKPKSKDEISAEVASIVDANIKREWKPVLYEEEYKKRIDDINSSPLYDNDAERQKQRDRAKKDFDEKCKSFYYDKDEELRIKAKYHNMDMLLTKTEKISFINQQSINMNTLIVGGSGMGKTRGYVMPNLLQAHSSYVFTDPKGEILEKGGYFLEHVQGYKVRALDLVDKSKSACFNPLIYLHPERPGYEERVIALVETIMINTDGGEKKDTPDPFWPKAERMFLQALIYAIPKAFTPKHQTFQTLLDLIAMLEIKDSSKEDFNSDLDIFFRKYKEKMGDEDFAYKTYSEFRTKAPDKTGNSVLMSILARMQPFRGSEIERIFSTDDMQLDRIGEEKTAIFIIVPPTDKTFSFVSGMLFTTLFQEIQYCASVVHRHEGQRLPVPVRLIFDEFANTCVVPNFVQLLAYARSFGVGMTIILQSLEQIKKIYEKEWGVIIDNCSSMLYLGGIKHIDTLNYFRDLLGKGTFDKKTTGRTRGRQGSSSTNEDVVGRGLFESDELYAEMKIDECILFVNGRRPFYSKKYKYEEHPNYRFTSDGNSNYSYEHNAIKHDRPHGEDNKNESKTEKSKQDAINENTITEIEIKDPGYNLNQEDAVRRLTDNLNKYDVISDDELVVEDGETSEKDLNDAYAELFLKDDTDESNITEIQKKDDGYSLDQEAAARRLAENFNKYDVISDDELMVEDGETSEEDLNDAYAELFLKDEKEDFLKVTPIDKLQEKEVTASKREIDIIKSLSFMVHNIKDLDFIPDDELVVEDGETSESDINEAYVRLLDETSEEDFVMDDEEDSLEQLLKDLEEELDLKSIDAITENDEDDI